MIEAAIATAWFASGVIGCAAEWGAFAYKLKYPGITPRMLLLCLLFSFLGPLICIHAVMMWGIIWLVGRKPSGWWTQVIWRIR